MEFLNSQSKKVTAVFFVLIILLTFFLYSQNLNAYFVSDDFDWINSSINRNPLIFFTTNFAGQIGGGNYGPIINLIYSTAYYLGGLNPLPYHLFSLLFHLSNILLIYFLARQFFSKKTAFLASLFFTVYFNNAEAISWIAAIPHVSATFFYLLAVFLWLKFLDKKKWFLYLFSLISLFSALLCKEIAISLPIVMVLLFFAKRPLRDFKKLIIYILPIFAILFGYLRIRLYTTGVLFGYYGRENLIFDYNRIITNILQFIASFFSSGQFRLWLFALIEEATLISAIIAAVLGLMILFFCRKHLKALIFWALIFGAICAPYVNLRMNPLTNEGERYLYLPVIALFILLAGWFYSLVKKSRLVLYPVLIALIIFSGFILYQKNQVWVLGSRIAEKIISDFGEIVNLEKQEPIIFMYLPDNVSGAQIFRNAIREAINFNYPGYQIGAMTLPIYIRLTPQNWQDHLFDWNNRKPGAILGQAVDGQKIIMGFDRRESDDYIFELWGYDYKYYITDKIYFEPKPILADSMKKDKIYFLYFDEGGLKEMDISVFELD